MQSYHLSNSEIKLEVLNYGAIIYQLYTKNHQGLFTNSVLSYHNKKDYLHNPPYLGAMVGPVAGRIKDGSFTINHQSYHITPNHNGNLLHSGSFSYAHQYFNVIEHDATHIVMQLHTKESPDGFPGNVTTTVTYKLDHNRLIFEYQAISDQETLFNPTQHSYFNLNDSHDQPITNHTLMINADSFGNLDHAGMVTNQLSAVENTPFDFREEKIIQDVLQQTHPQLTLAKQGLDHPFLLNKTNSYHVLIQSPSSGKSVKLRTNASSLVCYWANYMDNQTLLSNHIQGQRYAGICLETQNFPNDINNPQLSTTSILKADEETKYTTTFEFEVE